MLFYLISFIVAYPMQLPLNTPNLFRPIARDLLYLKSCYATCVFCLFTKCAQLCLKVRVYHLVQQSQFHRYLLGVIRFSQCFMGLVTKYTDLVSFMFSSRMGIGSYSNSLILQNIRHPSKP